MTHPNEDLTCRFESRDMLIPIRIEVLLGVVDCHATLDIGCIASLCAQLSIWILRHPLVGTVFVPEVHCCRPVVGKVLGVSTSGTASLLADIPLHCSVECISTYDLMDMGGRNSIRLYQRI